MEPIDTLSWISYTAPVVLDFFELLNPICVPFSNLQTRIFDSSHLISHIICDFHFDAFHIGHKIFPIQS